MERILVVAGPTAVGKTEYAVRLAKRYDGEVVSCDSMQLYKYLDIGSAKPTTEEMDGVPHHIIDCVDPREDFSVVRYREMADAAIADVSARGKLPIIAGGTGLYLDSLLYEMEFGPSGRNEEYREELRKFAEEKGAEALHERLRAADPKAAERIHPNNIKRVIRALEAAELEQRPLDDYRDGPEPRKDREAILIGLERERQKLYERIDLRVDLLIEAGLLEEVKGLMDMGFTSADISMKGIGYKEIMDYYAGEYDLAEAIRLVKRNTRHYAKRQMTWFHRYKDMQWFDAGSADCWEEMTTWLDKKL